jgi:UPF0271 protein
MNEPVIDLNCDLGEGAGADADVLPFITSANVACGAHAGDAETALATLRLSKSHGVAIGAHPGHPDREHFGRRELPRSPEQVFADCVYQIGALAGLAKSIGAELRYVKPHGGLYHQACRDDAYAEAILKAATLFKLAIIGLPGSRLEVLSKGICPFFAEGFADRRYRPDGSLVPRTELDAFVRDPQEAVEQVDRLIRERNIRTICVHGDNPEALRFVKTVRAMLLQKGYRIQAFA